WWDAWRKWATKGAPSRDQAAPAAGARRLVAGGRRRAVAAGRSPRAAAPWLRQPGIPALLRQQLPGQVVEWQLRILRSGLQHDAAGDRSAAPRAAALQPRPGPDRRLPGRLRLVLPRLPLARLAGSAGRAGEAAFRPL